MATLEGIVTAEEIPSPLPRLPGYDPNSLQPWTVQVTVAMTVLSFVCVVLRVISRRIRQQELWWDDSMVIFSLGWYFVVVGFIFAMYNSGMGLHADKVEPTRIVMMAKWLLVAEILYAWNLGWTKVSLLLMYYRIFHVPYFKKMAWFVGGLVMAWVICITFLFIFICVPVQKLWYPEIPGHCINQVGTWIANASSTIITDLAILILPIPQIWKLQLRKTEKIGLTFAFGLGFFVVFASAYRTSVLFTYSNSDPTYTLAPTVGWTVIEVSAGIISACLPTLLPVFRLFAGSIGIKPNFLSSNRGTSSAKSSNLNKSNKSDPGQNKSSNVLAGESTRRSSGNAFYRLADETESDGSFTVNSQQVVMGSKFRPDTKGYKSTVKNSRIDDLLADLLRDDMPLHGIRVRTEFEQCASPR
ncbi:putative PTH11-type G-protein coupled receptor protein [Trichoderma cornu-damae]|uniref:PTH11-type G-protein coupled receptor protein n=1 Tax=Trichoderma cornu-damae TaxID=654480 RepID=A0A9P8QGE3_9HYPO|nr:putative PTH11-type G-protein coupled receptor protein [Trichoderma cornu-damae]